MKTILNKIINNPSNKTVLKYLNINIEENTTIRTWKDARSGFDEGGCIFFEKYGIELPEEIKFSFDLHNIMTNIETGEIFAFHTGRFSIFFKCDFERSQIENSDDYRKGYTFDCITDITELGENWSFIDKFIDEEEKKQQLIWSFELTNKTNR